MEFPARFQLPLDPRQEVKGVIVDKCKYMDSKKQPLWLVFENAEKRGAPIRVIFKAGDDLRYARACLRKQILLFLPLFVACN
jgi:phosphatidylinositol-4,5-bisphosphate 3-kinase